MAVTEGFLGEVRCAQQMAGVLRILSVSFTYPCALPHPSPAPPQVTTVLNLMSNPHPGFALLHNACKSIFKDFVSDLKGFSKVYLQIKGHTS